MRPNGKPSLLPVYVIVAAFLGATMIGLAIIALLTE